MTNEEKEIVKRAIQEKIAEISHILMEHESKQFILERISPDDWDVLHEKEDVSYVMAKGPLYKRFIGNRRYLSVVQEKPEYFGTDNPEDVIKALQSTEDSFPHDISVACYVEYLRQENMAYVFEVRNGVVSDKVLRLDMLRKVENGDIIGGLLHAFRHFNIEEYETISYKKGEYTMPHLKCITTAVIHNFFSDDFTQVEEKKYIAYSNLHDGHKLKGVYFKEENIPVYFLTTLFIEGD